MKYCGYIKLATLEYPRYMFDILGEHPDIQYSSPEYGEFPHPPTYALVYVSTPPEHNMDTQVVDQTTPIQIDGKWYQSWFVRDLTEQELADRAARAAIIAEQIAQAQADIAANEARAAAGDTGTTVTFI